jgi:pantetheine-phosphate adenylyltransferase
MALMNRKIDDRVETIFLAPATEFSFLSSHSVKEVLRHNGDISDFVPPVVEKYFRQKVKLKAAT